MTKIRNKIYSSTTIFPIYLKNIVFQQININSQLRISEKYFSFIEFVSVPEPYRTLVKFLSRNSQNYSTEI